MEIFKKMNAISKMNIKKQYGTLVSVLLFLLYIETKSKVSTCTGSSGTGDDGFDNSDDIIVEMESSENSKEIN
jgi:hypothetical protein